MNTFTDPIFTFPVVVRLTDVERKTIENWMTHDHVKASGDAAGRDRRFSLEDMLKIVLLQRLRDTFNVQAGTAAFIAAEATRDYAPNAESDLLDIWSGGAIGDTAYRPAYGLTRDEDGQLRAWQRHDAADDVMIVIPVGLLARSLFAKAKIIMDAAKAD